MMIPVAASCLFCLLQESSRKTEVEQIWTIGERKLAMSNNSSLRQLSCSCRRRKSQQWKGGALFICGLSKRSRHRAQPSQLEGAQRRRLRVAAMRNPSHPLYLLFFCRSSNGESSPAQPSSDEHAAGIQLHV